MERSTTARHTSQEDYDDKLTDKSRPQLRDVLITKDGSIGRVAIVDRQNICINQSVALLRPSSRMIPLFLKYLLETPQYQRLIEQDADGSTIKHIYITRIDKMKVGVPETSEQKKILHVLRSLDDKIELLRRQNKILEKIAQTIFKERFFNFTINGKKLKIDNNTGLPEGWRMGTLGDILELAYGKAMKEGDRTSKGYPVVGSSGIIGYHGKYLTEGPGIVVGRKGSMGTVIWIEDNFFPIDTTFYVVDRLEVEDLFFHYLVLQNIDFQRIGSDSAVPGLSRILAYSLEFVVPKKGVVKEFNKSVSPIFQKMKSNNSQIQTLSKLRDTLLPKLMKGEIRVKQ